MSAASKKDSSTKIQQDPQNSANTNSNNTTTNEGRPDSNRNENNATPQQPNTRQSKLRRCKSKCGCCDISEFGATLLETVFGVISCMPTNPASSIVLNVVVIGTVAAGIAVGVIVPLATGLRSSWPGNYMPDSTCDTTVCCCPFGPMVLLENASSNSLKMNISLNSTSCYGFSYYATDLKYPPGNTVVFYIAKIAILWTITKDAQKINVYSGQEPACRSTYTKQNTG